MVLSITAVADNFTNKYPSEKLNFNKTTDETVMVDLNFDKPVTSFSISGTCKLDDANRALFRAILIDNTGKEYLVAGWRKMLRQN